MARASLDIGSNSIVFLVLKADGSIAYDDAVVVSLGRGLEATSRFQADRMDAALEAITKYSAIAKDHGVQPKDVVAVATSASRRAENATEFFEKVFEATGVKVSVISGADEASFTWRGALSGLDAPEGSMGVVDIGGGSSEVVCGMSTASQPSTQISLEVGTVRLTEMFFDAQPAPYTVDQFHNLSAHVAAVVSSVDWGEGIETLVGVAGTATTLAAMELGLTEWDRDKVHGTVLTLSAIETWIMALLHSTPEQRLVWAAVSPARAHTLLAGAAILHAVCAASNIHSVTISDGGIRHGVLA